MLTWNVPFTQLFVVVAFKLNCKCCSAVWVCPEISTPKPNIRIQLFICSTYVPSFPNCMSRAHDCRRWALADLLEKNVLIPAGFLQCHSDPARLSGSCHSTIQLRGLAFLTSGGAGVVLRFWKHCDKSITVTNTPQAGRQTTNWQGISADRSSCHPLWRRLTGCLESRLTHRRRLLSLHEIMMNMHPWHLLIPAALLWCKVPQTCWEHHWSQFRVMPGGLGEGPSCTALVYMLKWRVGKGSFISLQSVPLTLILT